MVINLTRWWIGLLPPAWFAALDDLICGNAKGSSWALAGMGIASTVVVLWLAFGRLAGDYCKGLTSFGGIKCPAAQALWSIPGKDDQRATVELVVERLGGACCISAYCILPRS